VNLKAKEWADDTLAHLKRVNEGVRDFKMTMPNPTAANSSTVTDNIAKALATDNAKEFLRLVGPYIMAYIMNQTRGRGNIKPVSSSIY